MLPSVALLFTFAVSAPLAAAQVQSGEFVGPATCNASCCHGATKPLGGRIDQTEYSHWFTDDPHRRAWESLRGDLGRRMGERLGIADVAKANECLSCHATPATASSNTADFGVSCESCHGAASGWYGTHFLKGFDVADAVARQGFVDLKDPAQLAQRCLACHLGDAKDEKKLVDHRLIAAGHPDLRFETGRFLVETNPHWRQRGDATRAWLQSGALVGQLVALREQAAKLGRDASTAKSWPEFSDFDCASCHHAQPGRAWQALRDFRLARKRPTPVGRPLFDASRVATANAAASAVDAKLASELTAACEELEQLAGDVSTPNERVAASSRRVVELADRAVEALKSKQSPGAFGGDVAAVAAISAAADATVAALGHDAERVAAQGELGAWQAVWLLQSLRRDFDGESWRPARGGATATIESLWVAPLARHDEFEPSAFARRLAAFASPTR
jgi:hypothetical protein